MAVKQEPLGWWGNRFQAYVLDLLDVPPTAGRLRYAQRDQVTVQVTKGKVLASVAVGQFQSATVSLKVKPFGEREWRQAFALLASDPTLTNRLLSGNFGPELELALAQIDLALFPEPTTNQPVRCSCRTWGCRHTAVFLVKVAALFDSNPFLWFEVLGRTRAEVLAGVKGRVLDPQETSAPLDPDRFWSTPQSPIHLVAPGEVGTSPDAMIRLLGRVPLPVAMNQVRLATLNDEGRPVSEGMHTIDHVLRDFLRAIGEGSRQLATGESIPPFVLEAIPGKQVNPSERLVAEIVRVVREEDGLLSVNDLVLRCPTAAVLPNAYRAIHEALHDLPLDLINLADAYVGPREGALQGAHFRHVVTFHEWYSGRLQEADWTTALAVCDLSAGDPWSTDQLQVGDELHIHVDAANQPVELNIEITPRNRRNLSDRLAPSFEAVRMIKQHLATSGRTSITPAEAVAIFIGSGLYLVNPTPDEVGLLPLMGMGLYPARTGLGVGVDWSAARPFLRRGYYPHWTGRENAVRWFSVEQLNQGEKRAAVERGITAIRWWCQYWSGAQDTPAQAPSVGALLHFLWQVAPVDAKRNRLDPDLIPGYLGDWFRVLVAHCPAVSELYQPHIAACDLVDAYQHRLKTFPAQPTSDTDLLAWQVEGYRWIGKIEWQNF